MTTRKAYSTAEVAESLGVSDPTIRRLLKTGELKGFKMGSGAYAPWRVSADALDAYIKEMESRS